MYITYLQNLYFSNIFSHFEQNTNDKNFYSSFYYFYEKPGTIQDLQ